MTQQQALEKLVNKTANRMEFGRAEKLKRMKEMQEAAKAEGEAIRKAKEELAR